MQLYSNPNAVCLCLSSNSNANSILENNIDRVYWEIFCSNPNAIRILENYIDEIIWHSLSWNPNAISILEKNTDKIYWYNLCSNEGVSELNYQWLKERMDIIREDLMKAVYHPRRLKYYFEHYDCDIFEEN